MTPISEVFMLSIDSKLDYALLKKICLTGHSRVPVYEEVDVPVSVSMGDEILEGVPREDRQQHTHKVKKIVGILLVKQCVLLDPKGIYIYVQWLHVLGYSQQLRCYSPSQYSFKQSTICP